MHKRYTIMRDLVQHFPFPATKKEGSVLNLWDAPFAILYNYTSRDGRWCT